MFSKITVSSTLNTIAFLSISAIGYSILHKVISSNLLFSIPVKITENAENKVKIEEMKEAREVESSTNRKLVISSIIGTSSLITLSLYKKEYFTKSNLFLTYLLTLGSLVGYKIYKSTMYFKIIDDLKEDDYLQ